MANTITYASLNEDSRLLKIASDGSDEVILTWDQTTNELSSSHFTDKQLEILQERFDALISNVESSDKATMTKLLQSMVILSEWKGVGTPIGDANGTTATLSVTGFQSGTTYYLVITIPHSIGPLFGPAPL